MASLVKPTFFNRLPAYVAGISRTGQLRCRFTMMNPNLFTSKRTLLSDAYHADSPGSRELVLLSLSDEMKINLDRSFYDLKEPVMSVELHKYIDNVYDKEELDVAEGYLYCYRHSPVAHHLRPSTVHSWLRLCIELGYPKDALKVLQNKRDYGLFPENYTYNLLLDTFLRANDIKGACDVAVVMMKEETLENCPLSQLLSLYACHKYLKMGDIPEDEQWDIGMTIADASRGVGGSLSLSYHALGCAMTGDMNKAIRCLQNVAETDGSKIAQEALDRIAAILQQMEDENTELLGLFETTTKTLSNQGKVTADTLDLLLESEVSKRLPDLERKDTEEYTSILETWHAEHMEALEKKRIAELEAEREAKEKRLDELLRATGGITYWAEKIEEAKQRKAAAEGKAEIEHR
ncbi:28S ribosomal protein S27, mitochondrial-like [Lytechinus variegatus]|uniref:28S ribosomal protein S27, mitochondrial-like n=1 Tax=Lytechinus variegatus TaxID=7654 RepID=UPI001BB15384|nr:28S ribosomal protein S27, mitochondrial-like [Lytechinus variegatus]